MVINQTNILRPNGQSFSQLGNEKAEKIGLGLNNERKPLEPLANDISSPNQKIQTTNHFAKFS